MIGLVSLGYPVRVTLHCGVPLGQVSREIVMYTLEATLFPIGTRLPPVKSRFLVKDEKHYRQIFTMIQPAAGTHTRTRTNMHARAHPLRHACTHALACKTSQACTLARKTHTRTRA